MDKAGAPGLPLHSQAGRHATGRWLRHGQQTSVGKLGILSHIFTYWQIGVPKIWDRKRLLYMAEMMNKQQNKHSKIRFTESFLRQGLQKACTRLSKGHGNFATTWCTSSWFFTTWWVGFLSFQLVSAWFNDTRGLEPSGQIWTLNFTEPLDSLDGNWCVWSHKIDKRVHKYVS